MQPTHDTIDLGELLSVLRRRWRWIVGGAGVGSAVALAATLLLTPKYEASASILLRTDTEPISLDLSNLANLSSLGSASGFETELAILTSRSVIGEVVDSLHLQAQPTDPRGLRPDSVFSAAVFPPDVREARYSFERDGEEYRVLGPATSTTVRPGEAVVLGAAQVTLLEEGLPDAFSVKLVSRERAIKRVIEALEAGEAGGEVAQLLYRSPSATLAADVPNAIIRRYMARRRTTDRGINQHRYEFLLAHADSISRQLVRAEQALRVHQEASGVIDPELIGSVELRRAMELQAEAEELEVEARTLQSFLEQRRRGALSARDLAAYPTFLSNTAISGVLSRLMDLEAERIAKLELQTERDPEVVALSRQIEQAEDQLQSLVRSYLQGVTRRLEHIRAELVPYRSALAALPSQAERSARLRREVERLSAASIALQGQLLEGRLAAMAEGGDVRPVDVAVRPEKPVFPRLPLNLAVGLLAGAFLGVVGALGGAYYGTTVREPRDAEFATGVPAIRLLPTVPLLLGAGPARARVLVISVGSGARSSVVAQRIASAAVAQGKQVAVADLGTDTGERTAAEGGSMAAWSTSTAVTDRLEAEDFALYRLSDTVERSSPAQIHRAVQELMQRFGLVVVGIPGLQHPALAALLDGDSIVVLAVRAGRTTRSEVREVVDILERLGIRPASIIVHDGEVNDGRSA